MKHSAGYVIRHEEQMIILSKAFSRAAGQLDTDEYRTLVQIRKAFPTYHVVLREIRKACNKRSFRGLSYSNMEAFLADKHSDRLDEFNGVLREAPSHGCAAYAFVKKWFLENFGEEV